MRRVLNEVGSEIPDVNALTQRLKFKYGFADVAEPTPELLKNYMDVSNSPLFSYDRSPPAAVDPRTIQAGTASLWGVPILGGWWKMPASAAHLTWKVKDGDILIH